MRRRSPLLGLIFLVAFLVYYTCFTATTNGTVSSIANDCKVRRGKKKPAADGKKFYINYKLNDTEYSSLSPCTTSQYDIGSEVVIVYSKQNPQKIHFINEKGDKTINIFLTACLIFIGIYSYMLRNKLRRNYY